MHTVTETATFERAAKAAGMTGDEIEELISYVSENPTAGDEIPGAGGCRKLRWARPGMGKSKGYRTITLYSGEVVPVFLLTVFKKGQKSDLTQSERNALREATKRLAADYMVIVAATARRKE